MSTPKKKAKTPNNNGDAFGNITQHALQHLREVQAELAGRKLESLRLYEPMPLQKEFHESMCSERLLIGGNRSGKSCASFVEEARAATGQDPYDKYPKTDGNIVIVGRNWPHIGLVAYPMLFRAGAFKIIRDKDTGEWRAFKPGDDRTKAKPAPPLIPPRFVKETSWVLKSAGYCQKVTLNNGWVVNFFSSEGEPPQGFQADLVHIDEDINNERWGW